MRRLLDISEVSGYPRGVGQAAIGGRRLAEKRDSHHFPAAGGTIIVSGPLVVMIRAWRPMRVRRFTAGRIAEVSAF